MPGVGAVYTARPSHCNFPSVSLSDTWGPGMVGDGCRQVLLRTDAGWAQGVWDTSAKADRASLSGFCSQRQGDFREIMEYLKGGKRRICGQRQLSLKSREENAHPRSPGREDKELLSGGPRA